MGREGVGPGPVPGTCPHHSPRSAGISFIGERFALASRLQSRTAKQSKGRIMNQLHAMLLPLVTVFAAACYGAEAPPATDATDPSVESGEQAAGSSSLQACAYKSPPRCGARNCVAMCVTCFYDVCRAAGGSCVDCKQEMEICKDECGERECPPSNPFCDFETP
jgi:hypothetical protein